MRPSLSPREMKALLVSGQRPQRKRLRELEVEVELHLLVWHCTRCRVSFISSVMGLGTFSCMCSSLTFKLLQARLELLDAYELGQMQDPPNVFNSFGWLFEPLHRLTFKTQNRRDRDLILAKNTSLNVTSPEVKEARLRQMRLCDLADIVLALKSKACPWCSLFLPGKNQLIDHVTRCEEGPHRAELNVLTDWLIETRGLNPFISAQAFEQIWESQGLLNAIVKQWDALIESVQWDSDFEALSSEDWFAEITRCEQRALGLKSIEFSVTKISSQMRAYHLEVTASIFALVQASVAYGDLSASSEDYSVETLERRWKVALKTARRLVARLEYPEVKERRL